MQRHWGGYTSPLDYVRIKDGGKMYDLIIIGSGPAGLSAALFGGRYSLRTQVIGSILGGAMAEAWEMQNYPGFKSISGVELAQKMKEQVEAFDVKIVQDEVIKIKSKKSKIFQVMTRSGKEFESRALILALGTQRKTLNVPGETKYHGHGVSYCPTCDAAFFRNKTVGVVGGGDAAITGALLLERYAQKIYLFVRGEELKGEPANIKRLKSKGHKVEIIYNVEVVEIRGNQTVEGVKLNNGKEIKLDGIFVEIGATPASALIKDIGVETDERGYIKVDENQRTNVKYVYAAGDVTNAMGGFKQTITAAAQGAVAAASAYRDLTQS